MRVFTITMSEKVGNCNKRSEINNLVKDKKNNFKNIQKQIDNTIYSNHRQIG